MKLALWNIPRRRSYPLHSRGGQSMARYAPPLTAVYHWRSVPAMLPPAARRGYSFEPPLSLPLNFKEWSASDMTQQSRVWGNPNKQIFSVLTQGKIKKISQVYWHLHCLPISDTTKLSHFLIRPFFSIFIISKGLRDSEKTKKTTRYSLKFYNICMRRKNVI